MHSKRSYVVLSALVVVAFAAGLFLGMRTETQATLLRSGTEDAPDGINLAPVWKTWRLLDQHYVPASTTTKQLSKQDRVWGMIQGLAASYNDPYTLFMPPQEAQIFSEEIRGEFGGIGVEMGVRDNILTVIAPLKGTPADQAGILAGDLILEVDGTSTSNINVDEAVHMIRGEIGTKVVLTVARKGERELLHIPIVRDTIEIPTLDTTLRDDGVFVLSLYNFGGTATREVRSALRQFLKSGSDTLVIDLRDNPGGYLGAAVDIASWFLPIGSTVVTEDYGGNADPIVHKSKGYDITQPDWRIAVLVDGGSASASEILAGALREHNKAVLVGQRTFGKGSVQELLDITPDTSLKVTVARWLTPNGRSISNNGIEPDLIVPITRADMDAGRDPQLDAAVHYVLTGTLSSPATTTASSTREVEDDTKVE